MCYSMQLTVTGQLVLTVTAAGHVRIVQHVVVAWNEPCHEMRSHCSLKYTEM